MRALAILALLSAPAAADPGEVARVMLFNSEAVLYDDGTWAFPEGGVTVTAEAVPSCLEAAEARIRICPPEADWTGGSIWASRETEERWFETEGGTFSLQLMHDGAYGHDGDMSFYDDYVMAPEGVMERVLYRLLGLGTDLQSSETVVRRDPYLILFSRYESAQPDYLDIARSVEIMLPDRSVYIDLTAYEVADQGLTPDGVRETGQEADRLFEALLAGTTVDGVPLAEIREGQAE